MDDVEASVRLVSLVMTVTCLQFCREVMILPHVELWSLGDCTALETMGAGESPHSKWWRHEDGVNLA